MACPVTMEEWREKAHPMRRRCPGSPIYGAEVCSCYCADRGDQQDLVVL